MVRREKKYHYVYKTICVITNKYYIGIHSTDDLNDGYLGSGRRLKYSVKKYGKENHFKEILCFTLTREDALLQESMIVNFDRLEDEKCLNLCVGGGVNPLYGKYLSEEHRNKISKANSGKGNGMYGKKYKMSDERKNKISESLLNSKKLKESRNSKEYKDKISKHFSIPTYILDINLNIIAEYPSLTSAVSFFDCTESNVFNARRFKRKIKRKYWVVYKDDYEEFKKENHVNK